ncbi:unnamed protein product, partial [Staurois parvus]
MGDTKRQLRWALICGTDGHWQVALMGDTKRQLRWALICDIDVALMGTEMW